MTIGELFKNLFDISFKKFITTTVIKWVYLLAIVLSGVVALVFLMSSLAGGGGQAFAAIVIAPLGFVLYVLWIRICLEVILVLFRVAEGIEKITGVESTKKTDAEPSTDDKTTDDTKQ